MQVLIGIKDTQYPATLSSSNGQAVIELHETIPYGPYANQARVVLAVKHPLDAVGQVVNETVAWLDAQKSA